MKDFRQFLLRGNLVDMAVGIVIGVAFAALVTALVKASHFIETKPPEQIADAVPADLLGDRAQYIEALRASREIYAPRGQVSPSGVDTVMKSLESFGVFKEGQKIDVATTYDRRVVTQAVKDLHLMLAEAARAGQQLPGCEVAAALIESCVRHGEGDKDSTVIVEELRRRRSTAARGAAE